MKINNNNISTYCAELISKKIYPSNFEKDISYTDKMLKPYVLKKSFKMGRIELNLLFKTVLESDIDISLSKFINDLKECTVRFKINNSASYEPIEYKCILDSITPVEEVFYDVFEEKNTQEVQCTLIILEKYLNDVVETINLTTTKTITVSGNKDTPCVVEITPTVTVADITITGLTDIPFTINNLTVNKKIIINGEEGKITEDNNNKFGSINNMWEFPRLKPGNNTISVTRNNVNMTIKYKPRYV